MRIQHNIMAMNAYRNYTNNVSSMKKNLEKLSSGYKINRAGDDAAGLAISEKMRAQITGLETAQKNAKDGISLVQTAEGALTEVHDMLNRMVELATQSANGTYDNTTDRYQMQKEVNQLLEEIDRIADSSNFNGINLLDGTLGLNTDVFKVETGNDYVAAVPGGTTKLTATATHGGENVAAAAPSFTVNLKDLEATIASKTGSGANKATFTFTIAGQTVTASIDGNASGAGAKNVTATNVAAAIAGVYDGTASAKCIKIGDVYFGATNNGGVLTFSMKGYGSTGFTAGSGSAGAAKLTEAQVKAVNTALNTAKVSVNVTGAGVTWENTNNIDHGIDYTAAVFAKKGGLLGGEIDITNLLADGASLKIDDTTFTVKLGAGVTGTGKTLAIDTDKFKTETEQMEELKRLLAAGTTTNFNITTAAGKKISIDQKATDAGDFKSMADVTLELTAPTTPETIASTKLYVTGAAEKGNVLTIGNDKITFNGGENIDAVMSAIKGKGYTVTKKTDSDGKAYLNIEGKKTDSDGNTIPSKDITGPRVLGKGLTLQIGDTSDAFNQLNVAVQDMHAESLGIGNLKIDTEEAAQQAIKKIKDAINTVSDVRGTLGATQNRLDHTINNLSVMTENIQDAESTIRDTDVAEEMMAYTKNNILIQSAQAMLAQANQVPQGVLQLLQ